MGFSAVLLFKGQFFRTGLLEKDQIYYSSDIVTIHWVSLDEKFALDGTRQVGSRADWLMQPPPELNGMVDGISFLCSGRLVLNNMTSFKLKNFAGHSR